MFSVIRFVLQLQFTIIIIFLSFMRIDCMRTLPNAISRMHLILLANFLFKNSLNALFLPCCNEKPKPEKNMFGYAQKLKLIFQMQFDEERKKKHSLNGFTCSMPQKLFFKTQKSKKQKRNVYMMKNEACFMHSF